MSHVVWCPFIRAPLFCCLIALHSLDSVQLVDDLSSVRALFCPVFTRSRTPFRLCALHYADVLVVVLPSVVWFLRHCALFFPLFAGSSTLPLCALHNAVAVLVIPCPGTQCLVFFGSFAHGTSSPSTPGIVQSRQAVHGRGEWERAGFFHSEVTAV